MPIASALALRVSLNSKLAQPILTEHQKYVCKKIIVCVSFSVRIDFLIVKLLYKSKCPSVCPYVNHV